MDRKDRPGASRCDPVIDALILESRDIAADLSLPIWHRSVDPTWFQAANLKSRCACYQGQYELFFLLLGGLRLVTALPFIVDCPVTRFHHCLVELVA